MTHCARLTSMRVDGDRFLLGLRSGDRDIAVTATLDDCQAHAVRHLHAVQRIRARATGHDALWDLLDAVADASGGAVTAIVVDLTGAEPAFRLRVGSVCSTRELPLDAADAVVLLAAGRVPVEVSTPAPPEDWDAALAQLVADET